MVDVATDESEAPEAGAAEATTARVTAVTRGTNTARVTAVTRGADTARVTGIVLAAGAGTRMGTPKALLRTSAGEPWLAVATSLLVGAGCDPVVAVLGARADEARALLQNVSGVTGASGRTVRIVVASRWAEGMAESLRAGLAAASGDAALITLVDMPDLPPSVVKRILGADDGLKANAALGSDGVPGTDGVPGSVGVPGTDGVLGSHISADTLRQAVYAGRPGHPVLVGRNHWGALIADISGDRGARAYLAAHGVDEVECQDLFDGRDIDTPDLIG